MFKSKKPKTDFYYSLERNERLTFDKIINKLDEFESHFRLNTVHIEYDSLLSLIWAVDSNLV